MCVRSVSVLQFSESTTHIEILQKLKKNVKTDFFALKGVPYHFLKYGRFLLKHPVNVKSSLFFVKKNVFTNHFYNIFTQHWRSHD